MTVLVAELSVPLRDFALDVALEVEPGACLALLGPSGAGKTTTLRAIAGLAGEARGVVACGDEVWLESERGLSLPPERRSVGYVFQDSALFPHLSALGNVAYGLRRLERAERLRRASAELARFEIEALAAARPADLSGGERRRVALARAVAPRPRALLLDEPLAGLDAQSRSVAQRELLSVVRELQIPALAVTHDFTEALLMASEVAVLDRGRIVQRDVPAAVAARPASAFVAALTGASLLTGSARPAEGGLTRVDLDGGGSAVSVDAARGPVTVGVLPWDITLEPAGTSAPGTARNHVPAEVASVTVIGNRARVGLLAPQPLAAEVTAAAASELGLLPGGLVVATWKATATRLLPRG